MNRLKMSSKVVAYILIVTEVGKEHEVTQNLRGIEGVDEVQTVYGEFDVVCKLVHEDLKSLDNSITKIRKNTDIVRTMTLISG